MTSPKVSIVMAVYNERPEVLDASIESVLNQPYKNIEILIMDDSTNPESVSCLDKYIDKPGIKLIRKEKRMGLSGARNVGIQNATGKYIAILDSDDVVIPERFLHQVDYLEDHPDVYILGGQMDIIDGESKIISERRYPMKGIKLRCFATVRNPVAHPTVMIRRELFDNIVLYDESLEMSEDLDLMLRAMNAGYKIENLDEKVLKYRVEGDFINKRVSEKQKRYMYQVRKKNWSNSHLVFSSLSCTAGFIFSHTPSTALAKIYKKENSRK